MDQKLTVFMMSSTHWDREWYEPFQGFRWRLVKVTEDAMDKLEANPQVGTFTFDGQTIVLEDFLEAAPDQKERLLGLMKQGRIKVGPWYVMPDEYLPSGESHIRNLQMGTAIAKSYGVEPMRYGYVCDIFGHPAQMPQIFRGFDCEGALLGRGITEDKAPAHFVWEAPDGSQVITFKTPDWYGYGEFWVRLHCFDWWREPPTEEERDENLKKFIEGELTRTDIPVLLFVDGQDHKELHARTLTDVKQRLERLYPGIEVVITSPDEMLPRLAAYRGVMPVVRGELNATNRRRGDFPRLLTNVLSSRYDLKWRNDTCQTMMEKWAGPITAVTRLTGRTPIRKNFYELAYRYLIQNHPHDSICGCSPDFVHRDMQYRFDQVEQIGHSIEEYGMQNISRFADTPGENMVVTLFNSLPYDRTETVTVDLFFDRRWKQKWSEPFGYEPINAFRLLDADGTQVPYQVVNINRGKGRVHCGEQGSADRHRIVFEAKLTAGGTTEYRVVPSELPTRPSGSLRTGLYTAENDLVRLTVEPSDGTLTITDKRTGETYDKQLSFVDDGELGDGYMHARPVADRAVLSAVVKSVAVSCDAAARCTFTVVKEMYVPKDMQKYHERNADLRRNEELEALTITANVSLTKSSPLVEIEMTVDNSARDHRLRLMIPTGVDTPTYRASQAFYVAERKVEIDPATLTFEEKEQSEKAMNGFAYKRRGSRGLCFVSGGGLHEVGAFPGDEGMLAVTLLRCFGSAVNGYVAEDGQMQGRWQYRFGLLPLVVEETDASIQRRLDAFAAGVRCRDDRTWQEISLERHSFYRLEGENTLLSTVKVAEDGEGIVMRFYNLSDTPETARLTFDRVPASVALTNLEERHPDPLSVTYRSVSLPMGAWQIRTVYVKF